MLTKLLTLGQEVACTGTLGSLFIPIHTTCSGEVKSAAPLAPEPTFAEAIRTKRGALRKAAHGELETPLECDVLLELQPNTLRIKARCIVSEVRGIGDDETRSELVI